MPKTTEKPKRASGPPRVSLTIAPKLRKLIRIAAARADLEIGEWCKAVIVEASTRAVKRLYPEDFQEGE